MLLDSQLSLESQVAVVARDVFAQPLLVRLAVAILESIEPDHGVPCPDDFNIGLLEGTVLGAALKDGLEAAISAEYSSQGDYWS